MFEVKEIRKNYEKFDDTRIKWIAEKEVRGLRDEIIPVLIEEIRRRNLDDQLIEWINAERRKLSKTELEDLKEKIKNCFCTICNQNQRLKGYKFITTTGILIDQTETHYKLIVCEKCGRKKRRNSVIWTSIFGWWSAQGLLSMPFILINKAKALIQENKQSEQIIESFIDENIREITLGKDSQKVIQKLLERANQVEVV